MSTTWLLIWFVFVPDVGVKYYHLGTYENETFCSTALRDAAVMVNDKNETVECIRIQIDD